MSTDEIPEEPGPRGSIRRWRRPAVLLPATVILALATAGIAATVSHGPGHSSAAGPVNSEATSALSSTVQPTATTSAGATTSPAVASSSPTRSSTPRTSAKTVAPHTSSTAFPTTPPAHAGGGPASKPAPPNPVPVTSPSVHPTTSHTTPKPPPPPPYVAHFVSVSRPAAFDGIAQGGAAQTGVIDCVRNGNCLGFGLEWGGSCSMPPYRGDTAGAQFSGWAMWQRGPDDCTWAEAVSSF